MEGIVLNLRIFMWFKFLILSQTSTPILYKINGFPICVIFLIKACKKKMNGLECLMFNRSIAQFG